jgi:hypothetical protein
VFNDESRAHMGASFLRPRQLPFHKIGGCDPEARRFFYDLGYVRNKTGPTPPEPGDAEPI